MPRLRVPRGPRAERHTAVASSAKEQREYYERRIEKRLHELGVEDRKCAGCGSTEGLTWDHINPQTKVANFAEMLRWYPMDAVRAEFPKLQTLCMSCNHHKVSLYEFDGEIVELSDTGTSREHPVRLHGRWVGFYIRRDSDSDGVIERLWKRLKEANRRAELAMAWGR